MDVERLRVETAAAHEAVEGVIPLMKADLKREEYAACLGRLHGVVGAWEEVSEVAAPEEWIGELLKARRRRHLLEQDLKFLGVVEMRPERPVLPKMSDEANLLGAMYVMEGSTLGGQLIARHMEATLNFEAGEGDSYFRGHGPRTGPMWKEFCDVLRARVPNGDSDAVIRSAREMFYVFGRWMQGMVI